MSPCTHEIRTVEGPHGTRSIHGCRHCGFQSAPTRHPAAKTLHACLPGRGRVMRVERSELGASVHDTPLPPELVACVHRGPRRGEVDCRQCGGEVRAVPTFACAVHGECTLRHTGRPSRALANCMGCRARQPPAE